MRPNAFLPDNREAINKRPQRNVILYVREAKVSPNWSSDPGYRYLLYKGAIPDKIPDWIEGKLKFLGGNIAGQVMGAGENRGVVSFIG